LINFLLSTGHHKGDIMHLSVGYLRAFAKRDLEKWESAKRKEGRRKALERDTKSKQVIAKNKKLMSDKDKLVDFLK
jgi:hypothetical protein